MPSAVVSPPTLELETRLARLEQSITRIEARLDRALGGLESMVATVGDLADDLARRVPDAAQRLETAVQGADQLTRPESMRATVRAVQALEHAPDLAATVIDIFDGWIAAEPSRAQALSSAAALLARFEDPALLRALHSMLDMVTRAPGVMATLADVADARLAQGQGGEGDPCSRIERLAEGVAVLEKILGSPATLELLHGIAEDPARIRGLARMAQAVGEAQRGETQPVGLIGLLRGLSHGDASSGASWMLDVLRSVGGQPRARSDAN